MALKFNYSVIACPGASYPRYMFLLYEILNKFKGKMISEHPVIPFSASIKHLLNKYESI